MANLFRCSTRTVRVPEPVLEMVCDGLTIRVQDIVQIIQSGDAKFFVWVKTSSGVIRFDIGYLFTMRILLESAGWKSM